MLRGKITHGRVATSCDAFASRGDPWDARVPKHFGLDREPGRFRTRTEPDGTLHRTPVPADETRWFAHGPAERPSRHVPKVQGDPDNVTQARREHNRRMRGVKARIEL